MTAAVATEPRELVVTLQLPIRVVSEANRREHWATKARRAKAQRGAALLAVRAHAPSIVATIGAPSKPRLVVTLTRIGVRALDSDNLARAFKAVRDGIADALGIDDGDSRIDWRYEQRRGGVREYAVEIRLEVSNGRASKVRR